jgi:RNA polymerase sigma-70 factor (ECF subfamily)
MNVRFKSSRKSVPMEESQDWSACLERVGSRGDREAFSALFAHFAPLLKSFLAAGAGQNSENIEELVQETMVKVWRKASNYNRSQSNANTWIYTIARNTRIDWIRKQIRQNPNQLHADDIYDAEATVTPHSSLIALRNKRDVSAEIKKLPPAQSEVLALMYFQGHSGQQVSEALNIPLGTVKSRVRLALKRLKIALAENELELEAQEEAHA